MREIIPVMCCFDNNYVIPAGVAFYSMLENANKAYIYKIYVLHSDILKENQYKLKQTITDFDGVTLEFIDMQNRFQDIFELLNTKGHYSKEMFYKFLAPSIFTQYNKIIITDVDVVFLGDISREFENFDLEDDFYLGAFKMFALKGSFLESCINSYKKSFLQEDVNKIQYGAGYYIYNLKKMRKSNLEEKFIDFLVKNTFRLLQPEQDTINIVSYPKIKTLNPNAVVCTYMYDLYKSENDFTNDLNWQSEDIKLAMNNPVQLHYATSIKPWKNPSCTKSEIWYKYLLKTPFYNEQMKKFESKFSKKQWYYSFNFLPILKIKNKKLYLFGIIELKEKI